MSSFLLDCGGIAVSVEAPLDVPLSGACEDFIIENKSPDLKIKIDFREIETYDGLKKVSGNFYFDIFESEDSYRFFYRYFGGDEYNAEKIVPKKNCFEQTVFVSSKRQKNFNINSLFDYVDPPALASMFSSSVFHASYIDLDGEALLFTAPSGVGKSTQADLWNRYKNKEIINGDKVMISVKDDIVKAHGLPFSGSSNICKKRSLKVKAFVRLQKSAENKAEIIKGFKAYKALFEGCYHIDWSRDLDGKIADIAKKAAVLAPVISYRCVPDKTAVDYLENFLINEDLL